MACPHVAACAALFIQNGDATTPAAIETRLEDSTSTVTHGAFSFPRIDCMPDPDDGPGDPGDPGDGGKDGVVPSCGLFRKLLGLCD